MADKSVGELIAAQSVTPTDLFVLEQNGTAKKLTGQVLENWLVSFADGHGGIHSIKKLSTSGLVDTYRITLADTTTFDFAVTNGRSITGISKTSTSGLVDTYTITYNDGTTGSLTVTNGEKGEKGDNQYVWIKYASQQPTASSHSFGDAPDNWIGIYSGDAATAPTDWQQYKWFQIKGEKGDTGAPANLTGSVVEYQVSDSGTIIPSGVWSASVPVVAQGKYLWTRTTNTFNTGAPVVAYSVSRMGLDGTGSVSSVANISPDTNGNVPLTAEHIGAVPSAGGDMTGELRMNGQPISGLNMPTANDQAANMGFVNQQVKKAAPRNLLDNSDFTNPVNQRGQTSYNNGYTIDRWNASNKYINVIVGDGKVTLSKSGAGGSFFQPLPFDTTGKKLTFAIQTSDGLFVHSFPKSEVGALDQIPGKAAYFGISGSGDKSNATIYFNNSDAVEFDLYWAAIYEGEYTAETLPEYQPKGYGAELAECQRYFYAISGTSYQKAGFGQAEGNNTVYPMVIVPAPMRVRPTATYSGNWKLWDGSTEIAITSVATNAGATSASNCSQVSLTVISAASITVGKMYTLAVRNDYNAYLWLSADL